MKIILQATITVQIETNGASGAQLDRMLESNLERLYAEGALTGDTAAEVESFRYRTEIEQRIPCRSYEWSLGYIGGSFSGVGEFAYVPLSLIEKYGDDEAFRIHTGQDPIHIIWQAPDEICDQNGDTLCD